ncbi:MAG: hypothetical protein LBC20_17905 [Planctomycetaceae bacterium]|jgi:hypothetical protein|nr:hypothetical protein [Planctomycetaceae bacterium]
MKTTLFFTFLFTMLLSINLCGQENLENEINSYLKRLESEYYTFLLNNYKIEDGNKNKKNEKKRIVISEIDFELPYNLIVSNFTSNGKVVHHKVNENHKDFIEPNELLKGYAADIFTKDYLEMGVITVTYTNSQYLARRILASNISGRTNRLLRADEFSHPNIGDDICMMTEGTQGLHRKWIFFIRDYTVFYIGINDPEKIDVEKLARNIDQKYAELNKKLNNIEETSKNKSVAKKCIGQENLENKIELLNSYLEYIEKLDCMLLLKQYKIEEGKKNKKNEKKRIVFSEIDFELPYNFIFRNSTLNENNKDYVKANELLKVYAADIFTKEDIEMGMITVTYTNSQYLARRILASTIGVHIDGPSRTNETNRFLRADKFSHPNIGDDVCIMIEEFPSGLRKKWIFFIRDYTVFCIGINDPEKIDIEKFAKSIDQKFVELNKQLNEKKPTNENTN